MNIEIQTFEELKTNFNNKLITIPDENKKIFIENEIREIEIYIDNVNKSKSSIADAFENVFKPKTNHVFDIHIWSLDGGNFKSAFNEYRLKGIKSTDYEHSPKEVIKQAHILVDYYNWLKEEILETNTKQNKNQLTHKQKLLALYYLGLDMSKFGNNVQSAKVLSLILDLDESNTKKYLTYFDGKKPQVKNKSNIEKVSKLFEHECFEEILDKIESDL